MGCKHAVRNEWHPCADSRRRRPQRLREHGQWASWHTTSVCPHESPLYSTTCTVHGLLHCVQKCMASRRGRGAVWREALAHHGSGSVEKPVDKKKLRHGDNELVATLFVSVYSRTLCACVRGHNVCQAIRPVTASWAPDALQQNTPMSSVVVCAGGARGVLRSYQYRLARWQHCSKPMPRSAWAVHAHVSEGCVVGDSTVSLGFTKTKTSQIIP